MIIELACSKTPQSARAARKEEAKQVRLNATFFEDGPFGTVVIGLAR
jgi:hypothetical protein